MTTPKERMAKMIEAHPEIIPIIEEARRKIKEGEVLWEIVPIVLDKPRCSQCGLVLEPVMMYSCPNSPCPSGLGSLSVLGSSVYE